MQLIAGRTAQEYNRRKGQKGAFWEDHYHATTADTDAYLIRPGYRYRRAAHLAVGMRISITSIGVSE